MHIFGHVTVCSSVHMMCTELQTMAWHYREVQLDPTPEIEVFHMLSERSHTKNSKRSIQQHKRYYWRKVHLDDQPVFPLFPFKAHQLQTKCANSYILEN